MGKHYTSAVSKVLAKLSTGAILTAHNALDHEDTTVGPYTEAVDRGARYAVIGWRGKRYSEVRTAREAAEIFVDRVGTTRARESAL